MVKPRGKIERHGKRPIDDMQVVVGTGEFHIAAWCPDTNANLPPEQVHLILPLQESKISFLVRFKSPDTLGFLIEELSRYRSYVWPDCEPVEFDTQFVDLED